jgi:hypothetical protein
MIKSFLMLVLLYAVALASITAHMVFFKKESHKEKILQTARIVNLPTLSLSTSYMATEIRSYAKVSNPSYPDMMPIDTMSFVYGQ